MGDIGADTMDVCVRVRVRDRVSVCSCMRVACARTGWTDAW